MVTTWTEVSKVGSCCGVQQSTVVYLSSVSQCQSTNFLVGNHRHLFFFFFVRVHWKAICPNFQSCFPYPSLSTSSRFVIHITRWNVTSLSTSLCFTSESRHLWAQKTSGSRFCYIFLWSFYGAQAKRFKSRRDWKEVRSSMLTNSNCGIRETSFFCLYRTEQEVFCVLAVAAV